MQGGKAPRRQNGIEACEGRLAARRRDQGRARPRAATASVIGCARSVRAHQATAAPLRRHLRWTFPADDGLYPHAPRVWLSTDLFLLRHAPGFSPWGKVFTDPAPSSGPGPAQPGATPRAPNAKNRLGWAVALGRPCCRSRQRLTYGACLAHFSHGETPRSVQGLL